MSAPLGFALVGCGMIARFHARALAEIPGARVAGLPPTAGFTFLHVLLWLIVGASVATSRDPVTSARVRPDGASVWLTLLVLLSPALWWLDKVHAELFVWSGVTLAVASLTSSPALSAVAFGAAATQNPAVAAAWPVMAAGAVWRAWELGRWRDVRLVAGLVAGAILTGLPVAYSWLRFGLLTPLSLWTTPHRPEAREIVALLIDPNIGFVPTAPFLVLTGLTAVAGIAAARPRALWRAELVTPVACAAITLGAMTQTTNINHGGTPGMNRHLLTLIPLVIPAVRIAVALRAPRTSAFAALAFASVVWSAWWTAPARPEIYRHPTALADYLWREHPGWLNPPPEVFAERVSHLEPPPVPVATPGCAKVLLSAGRWPAECPAMTAGTPGECYGRDYVCYANRTPLGYDFVRVGRWTGGVTAQ